MQNLCLKATDGVQKVCTNIDGQILTRVCQTFTYLSCSALNKAAIPKNIFDLICLILACNECYSNHSIERSDTLMKSSNKRIKILIF